MSRVRSARDINSALSKKGFRVEKDGDHIRYYFLDAHGEETGIKTKISHGSLGATVSSKLISLMAKQLHLTKKQVLGLIDCTMTEKEYRETLRGKSIAV